MGGAPVGLTVTDDPLEAFAKAQAHPGFHRARAPRSTFAGIAAQARAVHVIGTTGFDEAIS